MRFLWDLLITSNYKLVNPSASLFLGMDCIYSGDTIFQLRYLKLEFQIHTLRNKRTYCF